MTSDQQNRQPENGDTTGLNEIAQGVGDVVNAAFGVGASLAKVVADATAQARPAPPPETNATPLNAIVHYSLVAVDNIVRLFASAGDGVIRAGKEVGKEVGKQPGSHSARPATHPAQSFPVVRRGGTLRVPLSVENPGSEPMNNLTFLCVTVRCEAAGQGEPLAPTNVRFQPDTMSIAARDFEKLSVFIDTKPDTAPGRYVAILGSESGSFEISVEFEVLPDAGEKETD